MDPRSDIALGVENKDGEFLLAVRSQSATPEIRARLDEIRARARGEISIRLVGRVVKQRGLNRWRPLQIGCSIGHARGSAGTLGCFVSDGRTPLVLSNNHVLANENDAQPGDSVVQPSLADGGREQRDTVARLSAFVPLAPMPGRNRIDAAVARIEPGVRIAPGTLPGLGRRGDSGSLIVDLERRAVALLFAGNGFDITYANPIGEVLAGLGVRLL